MYTLVSTHTHVQIHTHITLSYTCAIRGNTVKHWLSITCWISHLNLTQIREWLLVALSSETDWKLWNWLLPTVLRKDHSTVHHQPKKRANPLCSFPSVLSTECVSPAHCSKIRQQQVKPAVDSMCPSQGCFPSLMPSWKLLQSCWACALPPWESAQCTGWLAPALPSKYF